MVHGAKVVGRGVSRVLVPPFIRNCFGGERAPDPPDGGGVFRAGIGGGSGAAGVGCSAHPASPRP